VLILLRNGIITLEFAQISF